MIKSLGKNWILAKYPLVLAQVGWGVLVLTFVLVYTGVISAQTRKSAASIPYSSSEPSNSFLDRPNPIRLVQMEQEVPLLEDDDPFALIDDLDLLGTGLSGWDTFDELAPQDQIQHPDIPVDFLEEDDDGFEIPTPRETLPTLQQNTSPGRSSRSPQFTFPTEPRLEDIRGGGERHPEENIILKELQERGFGQDEEPTAPVPPTRPPSIRPTPQELLVPPVVPKEPTYPPAQSTQPTPDESASGPLDFGKHRAKASKRFFRDCDVGQGMMFADQYGYPVEVAPLATFLVENPYAPLLDLGGSGVDFFGYQRGCPPARPCGWLFDNMEVFVGASGLGRRSIGIGETSYALHEGINWAGSLSPRFGLGAQFGVRAAQSTVEVNTTNPLLAATPITWNDNQSQVFITTGLFRRSQCQPFQYGVVYDWMSDSIYRNRRTTTGKTLEAFNLGQVRTELAYKHCSGFTWGFRGAFGTGHYELFTPFKTRTVTQLHGFFEKPFWCGSLVGFSAGGAPKGSAILSTYYDQPLRDKFSLKAGFTYMLPQYKDTVNERNAWEAAITLTFHPHGGAFSKNCNPLRAMFDIAGNGAMIVSHR